MHVYENALKNYTLNYTKLFSYAKRRDREQDIKQLVAKVKDTFGDNLV